METMKHFTSLFDCPVWAHDHAGIDNDKLKYFINNYTENNKGRVVSNNGGYQSDCLYLQTPELQDFFQTIIIDLDYYYKEVGGRPDTHQVAINSCWFNINGKNTFNWPHIHDGYLSVVYYVEADEDMGHLIFKHPSTSMSVEWHDDWFNGTSTTTAGSYRFAPKTGRCYIFPSWLEHKVDMNRTDKTRVSFALNTKVVKRVDKDSR
jgi:uncharacterized protein (TIGR02466 family)